MDDGHRRLTANFRAKKPFGLQAADYRSKSRTDWRVDARAAITVGRGEIGALSMLDMPATPSASAATAASTLGSKPTDVRGQRPLDLDLVV